MTGLEDTLYFKYGLVLKPNSPCEKVATLITTKTLDLVNKIGLLVSIDAESLLTGAVKVTTLSGAVIVVTTGNVSLIYDIPLVAVEATPKAFLRFDIWTVQPK